jgi:hypothetical protein
MVDLSLAQVTGLLRFSAQDLPFDIRPEFGTEIVNEIEPKVEGSFQRAEAHGI